MTPLYRNTGMWTRSAAYLAVVVAAFFWGIFELWRGAHAEGSDASSGALFGVLFIGGAFYAFYQVARDWRDVVASLDRDASGQLVATVWQPTGPKKVTGEFRNWRFHVAIVGKNAQIYFLLADSPVMPRPLRFDLRKGIDVTGLRTLAPEAMAEYDETQPKNVS